MLEQIIIAGLSAGALTVLLCSASLTGRLREPAWSPLHCTFCTSFWASALFDPSLTLLATVAVANIAVLLIHWSMTTYATDNEPSEAEAEDLQGVGTPTDL